MRIISGVWRGRRLSPLRGRDVRPTADRVREAWMSAMGGRFDGLTVLDLFAGSGALGLECLSRGARACTFVERAASSLKVLEANVATLEAGERSRVVRADALAFVGGLEPGAYDLAVADPPYDEGLAAELLGRFARRPFARELWVEHRSDESLPPIPGLRHRRYGDTTLTILAAPDTSTAEADPSPAARDPFPDAPDPDA